MLGAGGPQDTGLATLGIAAVLGHSGLSQPNRAWRRSWQQRGEEARPAWLWLWKSRL